MIGFFAVLCYNFVEIATHHTIQETKMALLPFKRLHWTPPKVLSLGFALLIIAGTVLLSLPVASTDGRLSWLNALFMSTSAVCVTGLSVVDVGTELTLFGQIVLMVLFQLGGLGFVTMATLIMLILNKKISLKDRLLIQASMDQQSMQGIVMLIRRVLLYSLVIQLAGAVLFCIRFMYDMPLGKAVYYGIFHSISIFNNAGFDLFGDVHGPYSGLSRYPEDPIVNLVSVALIFLGGIGFIVLADILDFRIKKRLSLHSKVVLSVSLILVVAGAALFLLLEYAHALQPLSSGGKVLASLLQSVTPRSGGVTTLNMADLRQATQFLLLLLMFIGAAPGSTGGGIKVTTFALMLTAVFTRIRGRQDVVMFRRRIAPEYVYRAITLTMLSILVLAISTMILSITEAAEFLPVMFEAVSAYGTSGISMGITPHLSAAGKIVIMLLMFAGRIGPVTLAYAFRPKQGKKLYRHPEGDIVIG